MIFINNNESKENTSKNGEKSNNSLINQRMDLNVYPM